MANHNDANARRLGDGVLAWWRNWKRTRNARAELDCCGAETNVIARDVGLPAPELRVLAARRPDSAQLLYERLAALHLHAEAIASTQGAVMRDLQRLCTVCTSKARCARDLAADESEPEWRTYCPNEPTLTALAAAADDERAVSRLERRAARRGGRP